MKKALLLTLSIFLSCGLAWSQKMPSHYYVHLLTSKGDGVLKLYNETPKHRDNFVKLVKEDFYQGLLFHRVIEDFMIQGGDPDSRAAEPGVMLGSGGPEYLIDAEFAPELFHKKGALAAARSNNPEKASSASQFYIVHGRTFTSGALDSLETMRLGGRKIPAEQREIYQTLGGTPHLDQNYTVFGELVIGLSLVDSIAAVETNEFDRPAEDQRMDMKLLNRRESLNIERHLAGLKSRNNVFVRFFDLFRPKEVKL